MKVSIFKKLIREVVRDELDYKFSALEKKLDVVLVRSRSNSIVEDRAPEPTASPTGKSPVSVSDTKVPVTKDSILNDILAETAANDDWKKINEEPQVQSVTENTQGIPEHLSNALNKNYSEVMNKVEEKARFKNGS